MKVIHRPLPYPSSQDSPLDDHSCPLTGLPVPSLTFSTGFSCFLYTKSPVFYSIGLISLKQKFDHLTGSQAFSCFSLSSGYNPNFSAWKPKPVGSSPSLPLQSCFSHLCLPSPTHPQGGVGGLTSTYLQASTYYRLHWEAFPRPQRPSWVSCLYALSSLFV